MLPDALHQMSYSVQANGCAERFFIALVLFILYIYAITLDLRRACIWNLGRVNNCAHFSD